MVVEVVVMVVCFQKKISPDLCFLSRLHQEGKDSMTTTSSSSVKDDERRRDGSVNELERGRGEERQDRECQEGKQRGRGRRRRGKIGSAKKWGREGRGKRRRP